ncbi:vesicle coat component [Geranomyces michiganensis]|nr:vesicle coat component [Geranomyces michiganensis]
MQRQHFGQAHPPPLQPTTTVAGASGQASSSATSLHPSANQRNTWAKPPPQPHQQTPPPHQRQPLQPHQEQNFYGRHPPQQQQTYNHQQQLPQATPPAGYAPKAPLSRAPSAQDVNNTIESFFDDFGIGEAVTSPGPSRSNKIMDVFDFGASTGGHENRSKPTATSSKDVLNSPASSVGSQRKDTQGPPLAAGVSAPGSGSVSSGRQRKEQQLPTPGVVNFGTTANGLQRTEKTAPTTAVGAGVTSAAVSSVGFDRRQSQAPTSSVGVSDFRSNSGAPERKTNQPPNPNVPARSALERGDKVANSANVVTSGGPKVPVKTAQAAGVNVSDFGGTSTGFERSGKPPLSPAVDSSNFGETSTRLENSEKPTPTSALDSFNFGETSDVAPAGHAFDFGAVAAELPGDNKQHPPTEKVFDFGGSAGFSGNEQQLTPAVHAATSAPTVDPFEFATVATALSDNDNSQAPAHGVFDFGASAGLPSGERQPTNAVDVFNFEAALTGVSINDKHPASAMGVFDFGADSAGLQGTDRPSAQQPTPAADTFDFGAVSTGNDQHLTPAEDAFNFVTHSTGFRSDEQQASTPADDFHDSRTTTGGPDLFNFNASFGGDAGPNLPTSTAGDMSANTHTQASQLPDPQQYSHNTEELSVNGALPDPTVSGADPASEEPSSQQPYSQHGYGSYAESPGAQQDAQPFLGLYHNEGTGSSFPQHDTQNTEHGYLNSGNVGETNPSEALQSTTDGHSHTNGMGSLENTDATWSHESQSQHPYGGHDEAPVHFQQNGVDTAENVEDTWTQQSQHQYGGYGNAAVDSQQNGTGSVENPEATWTHESQHQHQYDGYGETAVDPQQNGTGTWAQESQLQHQYGGYDGTAVNSYQNENGTLENTEATWTQESQFQPQYGGYDNATVDPKKDGTSSVENPEATWTQESQSQHQYGGYDDTTVDSQQNGTGTWVQESQPQHPYGSYDGTSVVDSQQKGSVENADGTWAQDSLPHGYNGYDGVYGAQQEPHSSLGLHYNETYGPGSQISDTQNGYSQPSGLQYDQYGYPGTSATGELSSTDALQNTMSPDFDQRSSVSVNSSASNLMDFKSCPQCAKRNEAEANFCGKCGNGLKTVPVSSNRIAPEAVQQAFRSYGGEAPGRPAIALRSGVGSDSPIPPPAVQRSQPVVAANANMYRSSVPKRMKTPIHGNNGAVGQMTGVDPYQSGRGSPGPQHRQIPAEPPAFQDVLGRHRGHCIATFGPGGKLIVTGPMRQSRYISDAMGRPAMVEKTYPGEVSIKSVKSLLEAATVYEHGGGIGPLVGTKSKTKKKDVLTLVDQLIIDAETDHENSRQVVSATTSDGRNSVDGNQDALAEKHDQVLVIKLLKHLIEHDGAVFQSGNKHELSSQAIQSMLQGQRSSGTSTLPVDQIENALFASDRNAAVKIACANGLWAHALVIASNVNQDVYRDVVRQFSESHFGTEFGGGIPEPLSNRSFKPAMRVIFGLFGGMGPAIMNDYLPDAGQSLKPVTFEMLDAWREVLCIILANRTPGDSAAIAALGDKLRMYNKRGAAEFCHLIASVPNTIGGFDTPGVRTVLLGADHVNFPTSFFKSTSALRKTELFEYAQTLHDGAGIANALPHLQAYKVFHASLLADLGLIDDASKYCEAIELVVKQYARGSPYFHRAFGEALGSLMAQVAAAKGGAGPVNSSGKEASGWLSKLGSLGARGVEKFMNNALGETSDPVVPNRTGTPTLSHGRSTPGPGSAPLQGISNVTGFPSDRSTSSPLHNSISPLPFDNSIATSSYGGNFQSLGFQQPAVGEEYPGENFQNLGFQQAAPTVQYGPSEGYSSGAPPASRQPLESTMNSAYSTTENFASNYQGGDQNLRGDPLAAPEPVEVANGTYPDQGSYAEGYEYDAANQQYGQGYEYQSGEYSQNDGYGQQQQYDGYAAPTGDFSAGAPIGDQDYNGQNYNGGQYQDGNFDQSQPYGDNGYHHQEQDYGSAASVPAEGTLYGFSDTVNQYGQQPDAGFQNYNHAVPSGFGDEPQGFDGRNEFAEQSDFTEQQQQGFGECQGFNDPLGYQSTQGHVESHDFEPKESAPTEAKDGWQPSSYYDEQANANPPPPPPSVPNRAFEADDAEEDVLGLGNRSSVKSKIDTSKKGEKAAGGDADKTDGDAKKENSPTNAAPAKGLLSTIGSLFGGRKKAAEEGIKDGPVKANLGEKTSFVYDKKKKKWVNSAASETEEEKKELAPPPMAAAPAPNLAGPPSGNGSPAGSSLSLDAMSAGFSGGGAKRKGARRYVDVLAPDSAKVSPTASMSFLPPTTVGKVAPNAKIMKVGYNDTLMT